MTVDEQRLSADLKGGSVNRVYYFYGEEVFLTETYTKRVLDKTVGKDPDDINLTKLSGAFSLDLLSDSVESMPLFADRKAVLINDLDCDKLSDDDNERLLDILSDVPDECTVVISMTGLQPEGGRKNKNKALLTKLSKLKTCTVCEFKQLTANKIADLIIRKAAKNGCVISGQNAVYLANLTLNNLTLCSLETDKLCCYVTNGEITADIIDRLVTKQLDTSVYSLATAITKDSRKEAFTILDDLLAQKEEPIKILAALSATYIDFYRAAIARKEGKNANTVAEDFSYPKNRTFAVTKAFNTVNRLSADYIRRCISVLASADIKMKTSAADERMVLEQTVVLLFSEKQNKR